MERIQTARDPKKGLRVSLVLVPETGKRKEVEKVKNNLVMPVPRRTVQTWINRMNEYVFIANKTSSRDTMEELQRAKDILQRARQLLLVLKDINAVANWHEIEMDIGRISSKIFNLEVEKAQRRQSQKAQRNNIFM